jgi:photosystem II stability/assembly factor-like uncharacterized protein
VDSVSARIPIEIPNFAKPILQTHQQPFLEDELANNTLGKRVFELSTIALLSILGLSPLSSMAAQPTDGTQTTAATQSYDPMLWSGMTYRNVGPIRGGRVTAVTGVESQPYTFYMGSTGGGVWKTTDAGHTFVNVSDGQIPVGSIGAMMVAPSNPNVIYVGTGSSKIRSNVSIGRGMYKSTDAGKTWSFIGLRDTGQIATVRVDPNNADIVYVAAQGNPYRDNPERGVYKTTDGGQTWKLVLHISDTAGAADLEIQPSHPNVLFACMWHALRKPWTIISGAEEGGIYKSTDAGEHWTKLGGGLPTGLFGRSNVAVTNASPDRLYAVVEAKPGQGFYRSDDAGATWTLVNHELSITTRPFYYSTLGVDPNNADIVWLGDETWFKSTDAGKTFKRMPIPHGDNHDVWINPKNSLYMIQGDDGGATVSLDGGNTWTPQVNQPTAEIYQVYVDNQYPYRLYGAQQDNTTVIVPSFPLGDGQDYREGPGCETGPIIPDTKDPNIVYGGCKGQWSVLNLNTRNEKRYWVGAQSLYGNAGSDQIYRFQRVSPMEVSPNDPHVEYYGSQYLHRTKDGGVTWERISPDLTADPPGEPQGASGEPITRDATGEEIYSTLYAIKESSAARGIIWTGSNDGLVHVTRDDGKTWADVTPKGLPPGGRVQNIDTDPHKPGTAYVAIYRFLNGGDFSPYLYRTDDFGKSWTLLTDGTNGIAKDEPTRVVRVDPDRPGLLYAGTEFGMYISFDNGGHWQSFQLNMPATPITDIKVTHGDLQIATQGRSFYILDNITPLHELSPDLAGKPHLFKPREGVRSPSPGGGGDAIAHYPPSPTYPSTGAMIDYYLPQSATGDITLEILDGAGKHIMTFTSAEPSTQKPDEDASSGDEEGGPRRNRPPVRLDKTAGLHRFTWDLRYPGPWVSVANPQGPNGPVAVPGAYKVKLTAGDYTATQNFTVHEDPRITADGVTTGDLQQQFDHNLEVRDLVSEVNKSVARIKVARTKLTGDTGKLARLNEVASHMITPAIRYSKPELQTHITYLYSMTTATDQKIGHDAVERYDTLKKELEQRNAELKAILGDQFADLGNALFPGDVTAVLVDDDN